MNQYQTTAVAPKKRQVTTSRVFLLVLPKTLVYLSQNIKTHSFSFSSEEEEFFNFFLRYGDENTMKLVQFQKNAQLIGIVGYRFLLVTQGRTCFLLGLALLSLVLASSLA